MKKILTYVMVLTLLLVGSGARTAEARLNVSQKAALDINSKKVATISITATGTSSVKSIQIITYLERYKNKKWSAITSWSKVVYSSSAVFTKTHTLSQSGKYRIRAKVRYTGNSEILDTSLYSGTRTC